MMVATGALMAGVPCVAETAAALQGPGTSSAGASKTVASGPVTLETAVREAVAWRPSVIQAIGSLAARDEDVAAARAGYRPTISAGLGSGYDNRVVGT